MSSTSILLSLVDLLLLKATVILGVGWLVARSQQRNASAASAVWRLVIAALVALPLVRYALPPVALTDISIPHSVVQFAGPFIAIWIGGMLLLLVRWWADWRAMKRVVAAASSDVSTAARRIVRRAMLQEQRLASVRQPVSALPVEIRLTGELAAPAMAGWRQPVLLLPYRAAEWSARDLSAAVTHELGHIRRNDWAVACVERAVGILLWPNPFVHGALRAASHCRELAADQHVLRAGHAPLRYAQLLMRAASGVSPRDTRTASGALVAFSATQGLTQRIRAIATSSAVAQDRYSSTLRWLAPAIAAVTIAIAAPAFWLCTP